MRLSEKRYVEDPTLRKCKKTWPELECKKMNGMGQKDWPDRMFVIPDGRPFFIEFKSPGEVPTLKQAYMIAKLKRQGYDVEVYDDPKEAFTAIELRMQRTTAGVHGVKAKALDTTQLPEEGHQIPDRKNGRSVVPRPRARKN